MSAFLVGLISFVVLIVEINSPLDGIVKVSRGPMVKALEQRGR
jgi:hypothetical protein